jgi:hypothetical protein
MESEGEETRGRPDWAAPLAFRVALKFCYIKTGH